MEDAPHRNRPIDTSHGSPLRSKDRAMLPEVEVLDQHKEGSRWSTFYKIAYRFRLPNGAWTQGEREFLDRGDAVALLPYCVENGSVLLTRQFRMPVYLKQPAEAMLIEVCGGILDNPDPHVTLRHEALEELGLELSEASKIFEAYSTPGSVCEKVHYYIAPYTGKQRSGLGGGKAEEDEVIEVLEMPFSQALGMIQSGGICDARTVASLLYLAAFPPAGFQHQTAPQR